LVFIFLAILCLFPFIVLFTIDFLHLFMSIKIWYIVILNIIVTTIYFWFFVSLTHEKRKQWKPEIMMTNCEEKLCYSLELPHRFNTTKAGQFAEFIIRMTILLNFLLYSLFYKFCIFLVIIYIRLLHNCFLNILLRTFVEFFRSFRNNLSLFFIFNWHWFRKIIFQRPIKVLRIP
jgi:hypothetical protein